MSVSSDVTVSLPVTSDLITSGLETSSPSTTLLTKSVTTKDVTDLLTDLTRNFTKALIENITQTYTPVYHGESSTTQSQAVLVSSSGYNNSSLWTTDDNITVSWNGSTVGVVTQAEDIKSGGSSSSQGYYPGQEHEMLYVILVVSFYAFALILLVITQLRRPITVGNRFFVYDMPEESTLKSDMKAAIEKRLRRFKVMRMTRMTDAPLLDYLPQHQV